MMSNFSGLVMASVAACAALILWLDPGHMTRLLEFIAALTAAWAAFIVAFYLVARRLLPNRFDGSLQRACRRNGGIDATVDQGRAIT